MGSNHTSVKYVLLHSPSRIFANTFNNSQREELFQCEVYSAAFTQAGDLKAHSRIHSGHIIIEGYQDNFPGTLRAVLSRELDMDN